MSTITFYEIMDCDVTGIQIQLWNGEEYRNFDPDLEYCSNQSYEVNDREAIGMIKTFNLLLSTPLELQD